MFDRNHKICHGGQSWRMSPTLVCPVHGNTLTEPGAYSCINSLIYFSHHQYLTPKCTNSNIFCIRHFPSSLISWEKNGILIYIYIELLCRCPSYLHRQWYNVDCKNKSVIICQLHKSSRVENLKKIVNTLQDQTPYSQV